MTSEVPFTKSILGNVALSASMLGLSACSWALSDAAKKLGDSGPGIAAVTSVGLAGTGAMVGWEGVVKPIGRETVKKTKYIFDAIRSYSLRNDAVVASHAVLTGLVSTATCLTVADDTSKALVPAGVAALGAGYLYWNRKNLIQSPKGVGGGVEPFRIDPSSPLHLDHHSTVKLGDTYYDSYGAAFEARKFESAYRHENYELFQGKPADEIRALVYEMQAKDAGDKDGVLRQEWFTNRPGDKIVNEDLEMVLKAKFGVGKKESELSSFQKVARKALLETGTKRLIHPDLTNKDVCLKGETLSAIMSHIREKVRSEGKVKVAEPLASSRLHGRHKTPAKSILEF